MPLDQNAFYIELKIEPDNGHVYVRSDQVPGLHLHGKYVKSMRQMIEGAIKRLFRDNQGVDVNVFWLSSADKFPVVDDLPERLAVYPIAA